MELIIWFIAGAVSGYLAGVTFFEDEGVGVAGHVIVGSLAGIIGGYALGALLALQDPIDLLYPMTIVAAAVFAVVTVVAVNEYAERQALRI